MVKDESDIVSVAKSEKNSLLEKYGIPVEHLSYEYISDCKDVKELERIVLILRSGDEGSYPDLIKHAEEHLTVIKPTSKILRKAQPVVTRNMLNSDERKEIDTDISNWMQEMQCREKDLEEGKTTLINDPFPQPDIRQTNETFTQKKTFPVESGKKNRISSCDYAAWDKYDVDTEINRIDLQNEQEKVRAKQMQKQKEAERKKNLSKEVIINNVSLTATELNLMATREREKGNEAFRAGDYEEALHLYSASIAMDANAITYNNRAMTLIKLQRYADALNDCNTVIDIDYTNIKALLRRAACLEHLERNSQALADYETVLKLEPNNKSAIKGVGKLRKPCESKKTRMKIEEKCANIEIEEKDIVVPNLQTKSGIGSDICFCNRAPGSSKDTNPLPHIKAIYCLETPKNPKSSSRSNNNQSHTSLSNNKVTKISETLRIEKPKSIFSYTSPLSSVDSSGVIIKELPPDSSCTQLINELHSNKENKNGFCQSNKSCSNDKSKTSMEPNESKDIKPSSKTESTKKIDVASKYGYNGCSAKEVEDFKNIKSPYEFLRVWQSLKNDTDLKLHARLLRSLAPNDLPTVIGNKLDGTMFALVLRCLEQHFCTQKETELLRDILKALSQCSRFSIVNMFMNSADKQVLDNIFKFLEGQKCPATTSLRQVYST